MDDLNLDLVAKDSKPNSQNVYTVQVYEQTSDHTNVFNVYYVNKQTDAISKDH